MYHVDVESRKVLPFDSLENVSLLMLAFNGYLLLRLKSGRKLRNSHSLLKRLRVIEIVR